MNAPSPCVGDATGSQTTGAWVSASPSSISRSTSLDPSTPSLIALTSTSVSSALSCAPNTSASTSWHERIPIVFCTVSAVTTPTGRPPSVLTTRVSARNPAPPEGSSPEQIRTSGAGVVAPSRYGELMSAVERGEAGDVLPDDQRVNVVRALVGVDALEVQHVAAALVLVGHAVRAEDVAGIAGDVARDRAVVPLRKRDLPGRQPIRFLEAAEA